MTYIKTIADHKYEELQIVFDRMDNNKAIVIAALGLERLWTAFVSNIDETEYPELIELQGTCMEMMWNRVVRGNVLPDEYTDYEQLEKEMNVIVDPDGYGDCPPANASFLWKIFPASANWFFNVSAKGRAYIATYALEMLASDIYDTFDDPLLGSEPDKQYAAFLEKHPAILDEIARIDFDVALANLYPENIDEILSRKEYYHNLKIVPVS